MIEEGPRRWLSLTWVPRGWHTMVEVRNGRGWRSARAVCLRTFETRLALEEILVNSQWE